MPRVPPLSSSDVIKRLKRFGFKEVRQRGSHKQFRHKDDRGTTVPVHKGRDISPVLVRKIADDIQINVMEFIAK